MFTYIIWVMHKPPLILGSSCGISHFLENLKVIIKTLT